MLGLLVSIPLLFAQEPRAGRAEPAPAAGSNNGLGSLLPFLGIPIIFYLIMVRPQQQQERKRREMIDALKKNDKVLTAGGDLRHRDLGRSGACSGGLAGRRRTGRQARIQQGEYPAGGRIDPGEGLGALLSSV